MANLARQLAIKGHETRGIEVIEILEMLGGKNQRNHSGGGDNMCFYIKNESDTDIIVCDFVDDFYIWGDDEYTLILTLEEFLKKFPYKVGDRVQYNGATSCGSVYEVKEMHWDGEKVEYIVNQLEQTVQLSYFDGYSKEIKIAAEYLQPYNKKGEKKSLLASLIEHFRTTPKEVLEREWNEHKELDEIGPTVEEYIDFVESFKKNPKYPQDLL